MRHKGMSLLVLVVVALHSGSTFAQQSMNKAMQDINQRLEAIKAQSAAVQKAAQEAQVVRFRAHPEELADPHRCDPGKFTGTKQEQWWNLVACEDVSGITAERKRAHEELMRWRTSDCVSLKDCKAQVNDLRQRIEDIRSWRAQSQMSNLPTPDTLRSKSEPYPLCAITSLACDVSAQEYEALSAVEQYYSGLLKERDEELDRARKLLDDKEEQDATLDRLLDNSGF